MMIVFFGPRNSRSVVRLALYAIALLLVSGCASAPPAALPDDERIGVPDDPSARLADLEALVAGLESRHPAFRGRDGNERRKAFGAAAAELRGSLGAMSSAAATVELSRLVAGIGDGHTSLVLPTYSRLPLDLYRFGEDWFVVAASSAYAPLLGARLLSIGGVPIGEVESRLSPIVSHDNASGLASQLRYRLVMPELLAGVGVLSGREDSALIEAVGADGRILAVDATFWRYGEAEPTFVSVDAPAPPVLSRTRTGEAYWYSVVPGTKTLYLAYNRCREDPMRPMKAFAKEVDAVLASGAVDRVFIDLRGNGGGSSPLLWPLCRVLASRAKGEGGTPVYAAIGRRTFSSAVLNAAELAWGERWPFSLLVPSAGAVFVGEPSGGRPDHYGDVKSFLLPESGLRVQYSTKRFMNWPAEAEADALVPAIPASPTWSDYISGRDPALEAVIALDLSAAGGIR